METNVNNTTEVTPRSVGVLFGLVGALISIAYFLILNLAGIDMTKGFWNWLAYGVTVALLIFAHQQFKRKGNGYMTYGQGIGIAFWIGLISGGISSVFSYLYIKFIDTGFLEMVKERQIQALQEQGMSDQQIDKSVELFSTFLSAEALFLYMLVGAIAVTLIIALIVTIFTQKTDPEPAF